VETKIYRSRPVTITVASIIFAVFGILELVAGAAVAVLLGLVAGGGRGIVSQIIAGVLGGLTAILLIVSFIDLAASYGLWNMRRWGAILGMLVTIFGLIVQAFTQSIFFYPYTLNEPFDPYYYFIRSVNSASQWVNILVFILIAISWRSFEETPTQTSQALTPP